MSAGTAPGRPARWLPWVAGAALLAYLLTQYGYARRVPFINDDFAFLDLTRTMRFRDLWAWHGRWVGLYYRPWSRELHYWTLQHLFGARELPFHLASFALWLAALSLYLALARRVIGTRAAGVATAGVAALAAWGLPLVWVAGVQELWMLTLALAALLLFAHGRDVAGTVLFVLALLSKETALLLPGVAFALLVATRNETPRRALRRLAPALAVSGLWVAVHPQLGGRWWTGVVPPGPVPGAGPVGTLARTLLATVNLHAVPRPEFGWGAPLGLGLAGALCLLTLAAAAWVAADRERAAAPPWRGPAILAATWMVAGWLPLLAPGLDWYAYYGLFGMLGAWLLLGPLLARRRVVAMAVLVALALLRPLHAATASRDWGDEGYPRRAAEFLQFMRLDLRAKVPAPAPRTRFWFVGVPSSVGLLQGNGPALRVWYGDPTLSGGLFADYRARRPSAPPGPDRFFRFDSTAGWVEIHAGRDDPEARAPGPRWRDDHERLAIALSRGEDWPRAAVEYAKLAEAFPDSADYVYYAGLAAIAADDSAAGRGWLRRALRLPGADAEIRAMARRLGVRGAVAQPHARC